MLEPTAEDCTPPLTLWDQLWRYALVVAVSGLAWGEIAYREWTHDSPWFWVDLAGGIAAFWIVRYRRRSPFAIALVLTLFGLFSMASAGPGVLAAVSLFTRRNLRQIIPIGILNVVVAQTYAWYQPTGNQDPAWVTFTFSVVSTVAVVAIGMYIGSRRELIWTLRERAHQAEAEQELRVGRARSAERERIAREMHDVLAHRISLVTMHAGALAYRTDLPPEQVRETAELIQTKAHEAMTDLRQVLGMLRGEDGVPDRPQPTLPDLGTLMDEARTSGMVVDFHDLLPSGQLPSEQVGRTVYRIVQEALTNARKHAAGTHVVGHRRRAAGPGCDLRDRQRQAGRPGERPRRPRIGPRPRRPARAGSAHRRHAASRRDRHRLHVARLAPVDDMSPDVAAGPIRVLIVDDDALVRSGLALILGGAKTIEVVAQAADGRQGLAAVAEHHPDVVLMDIRMPVMDGIEATVALAARPRPPKVIVLTTFDADDYVVRALAAGASGFLLKDTAPEDIVDAVLRVADGEPMLSPSVTTTLIQRVTEQSSPERGRTALSRIERLTERERDVALAVGRGLSNAEIAQELYLSIPTVKAHIGRLFMKLEVDNRVQIALCVHDAGLAPGG